MSRTVAEKIAKKPSFGSNGDEQTWVLLPGNKGGRKLEPGPAGREDVLARGLRKRELKGV